MLDNLSLFIDKSHGVTLFVLGLLALYFIALNWVFFYRYFTLNSLISKETDSLNSLLIGSHSVNENSYLHTFIKTSANMNREIFDLGNFSATKEATKGLSLLSVVASTAPFIGLFGTVVSILDTFSNIGHSSGTMSVIAAGVSDALIATAAGIFVAIFAYTFHQIMKRKAYDYSGLIKMQSDALLARLG
ncbi:MAG: MotA/TolQ/ExbB proton channel family protein [Campylobacterota bacterium]|nr:MotA/TolQ/ExbB proton channel family protein [Campylobacterota bacterium]